jgi:hypothetical protein
LLRGFIRRILGSAQEAPTSDQGDCAQAFVEARAATTGRDAGSQGRNPVAIVGPSCKVLFVPAPLPESVSRAQIDGSRLLLPPEPRRNVAVIADTRVSGSIVEINRAIPFVGILTGLAYIGHRVVVFDGQLSRIEEGCRDADVLIVDGAVLPHLHRDWYDLARHAMRTPGIYMHDRKTYTLRPLLPKVQEK